MSLAIVAVLSRLPATSFAAEMRPSFEGWLSELRKEAIASGISESTIDKALRGLEPLPRVIKLDRHQAEFVMTLEEYLGRVVSNRRVSKGRQKLAEHRVLLSRISQRFGVQPRFLVALWGIETNYGHLTGNYPVISATATLAYDGRRSAFFRKELLQALRILDEGHITPDHLLGSWAGATGQFHFMPSSFRKFGLDYDGDGKIDIWKNMGDAFASAANYLVKSGWKKGQNWGLRVRLPYKLNRDLIGLGNNKYSNEWRALGVSGWQGQSRSEFPDTLTSVIEPEGAMGRAYMVTANYRAILRWNRSLLFGIAVGVLSEKIAAE